MTSERRYHGAPGPVPTEYRERRSLGAKAAEEEAGAAGIHPHAGREWWEGRRVSSRVERAMALAWARRQGLVEADGMPSPRTAALALARNAYVDDRPRERRS